MNVTAECQSGNGSILVFRAKCLISEINICILSPHEDIAEFQLSSSDERALLAFLKEREDRE